MNASPNYRRIVLRLAEDALRSFGGPDCDRERAATLLRVWPGSVLLDADLKNEVLAGFPAEPPAVPGLDFLPETQADADVLVAETVAALDDFQAYLTVACPACKATVGELCHGRDSAQWSHINRRNASALVEVVPQPNAGALVSNACTCGHSESEHISGVCMTETVEQFCPCGSYARAAS